jgi:hypothetical protein
VFGSLPRGRLGDAGRVDRIARVGEPSGGRQSIQLRRIRSANYAAGAFTDPKAAAHPQILGRRLRAPHPRHSLVIDRVGVVRWDDDSLACPGVTASSHAPVAGYILFMVQAGVPVSRELEYHLAGDREVFCGYSH